MPELAQFFQSLVHTSVFHTLPLQQLTHQSSSLSIRLFLLLYVLFCVPVSAFPLSLWHRFGTQNSFVEIQYGPRFAAFVPETFRSISAESHAVYWLQHVLCWITCGWVEFTDTMTKCEYHGEKYIGWTLAFGGERKQTGLNRGSGLTAQTKKVVAAPLHCTRFSRGKGDFLQGSWWGVEGATLGVFPGLWQALSACRDASLKNAYLILDVFA